MYSIGIKQLRDRLSHYVRIASQGDTVLVTDRDEVVAELRAPQAGRALHVADAVMADLVRNGLVTPPFSTASTYQRQAGIVPLETLLADLDADRGER